MKKISIEELKKNPYAIGGAVVFLLLVLWIIFELTGVVNWVGFM